jgi:hypothetical protein
MTVMTKKELPRELPERKALHKAARNLREILCGPTKKRLSVWRPADILPSTAVCFSSPSTVIKPTRYTIENPLSNFNLRVADIACAVPTMTDALRIAGLSEGDFKCWELHRQRAGEVRDKPDVPPKTGEHCYVFAQGYAGDYSEYEFWSHEDECRRRLNEAESLIERLGKVVNRIMQTVSPEAVLERLYISDDRTVVIFDDVKYEGLTHNQAVLLACYREGEGDWVPTSKTAKEIKPQLTLEFFGINHRRLVHLIDVKKGFGGRIILPMPAVK